jgi:ABC-2 type transport system ATP-binding protein
MQMIIQAKNLEKTYTTYERGNRFRETIKSLFLRKPKLVRALKGISFMVNPGELVSFLGPNGAGKSTTLKILTGVLYPTSGEVDALGFVPWKQRRKYVAHIGAVFGQKSQLIWDIPPLDAFHLNKAIYSIPHREFDRTLAELVEMLNIGEVIKRPTRQLSLGERMKCEFVMAMLHGPQIVFLDEPTIGLDLIAKERIREFIREMNRKGVTFILTTHDLDDVEQLAKRVIVINYGEIVFDDSMDILRRHFGARKVVRISTQKPLPELVEPGITITNTISRHDMELELDVSVMEVNHFIEMVNRQSIIKDLAIQELPIERVIKELYTA